jgi:hypothetical protein
MTDMKQNTQMHYASVPMQSVGPFKLIGDVEVDDLMVPLATYENPLYGHRLLEVHALQRILEAFESRLLMSA